MQRTSWRVALLIAVTLLAAACGRGGDDAGDDLGGAAPTEADEDFAGMDEEPTPTSEPEPVTYEVQDGDTLSSIASEHDVSIDAIVAANDLDDPDAIYPGDVLEIPDQAEDAAEVEDAGAGADAGAGDDAGTGDDATADAAEDD